MYLGWINKLDLQAITTKLDKFSHLDVSCDFIELSAESPQETDFLKESLLESTGVSPRGGLPEFIIL
jgi:hypothetical protein